MLAKVGEICYNGVNQKRRKKEKIYGTQGLYRYQN